MRKAGFDPRFLELTGAEEVPLLSKEPNPTRFRSKFYYNVKLNALFVKIQSGFTIAWQRIGGPETTGALRKSQV